MIGDIPGGVFLFFATMFFATSLSYFLGIAGKRSPNSILIGTGFALLAVCFVWLWVG